VSGAARSLARSVGSVVLRSAAAVGAAAPSACHTLRDAGTSGQRAPDLDLVEPSSDHVARFVQSGGVGMPPFEPLLTPDEIDAVADYVARVAGR
jgi:mono/diheme cytochrome c family protein